MLIKASHSDFILNSVTFFISNSSHEPVLEAYDNKNIQGWVCRNTIYKQIKLCNNIIILYTFMGRKKNINLSLSFSLKTWRGETNWKIEVWMGR